MARFVHRPDRPTHCMPCKLPAGGRGWANGRAVSSSRSMDRRRPSKLERTLGNPPPHRTRMIAAHRIAPGGQWPTGNTGPHESWTLVGGTWRSFYQHGAARTPQCLTNNMGFGAASWVRILNGKPAIIFD